jgi:hypothetical protein
MFTCQGGGTSNWAIQPVSWYASGMQIHILQKGIVQLVENTIKAFLAICCIETEYNSDILEAYFWVPFPVHTAERPRKLTEFCLHGNYKFYIDRQ